MASGRLVLITGAAGGIGRALVRRFIAGGDRVIAHDRHRDGVTEVAADVDHDRVFPISSELPDAAALAAVLQPVVAEHGPVGVVVPNAGSSSGSSLETLPPGGWNRDLDGNLTAGYVTVTSVLEDLKSTRGAIVFTGSVNGMSTLGDPAYSAAKAGLISYARALAVEYGRFGIRSNIVCPGTVRTPIWRRREALDPDILEKLRRWYPMGDVVEPEDIAEAVWFLASPAARMITGVVLPVDGGLTAGNRVMAAELTLETF
jgi:NAD(P)-dependent dehydrogenase (short-subunit alcohol dehydrogenase family)